MRESDAVVPIPADWVLGPVLAHDGWRLELATPPDDDAVRAWLEAVRVATDATGVPISAVTGVYVGPPRAVCDALADRVRDATGPWLGRVATLDLAVYALDADRAVVVLRGTSPAVSLAERVVAWCSRRSGP